MPIIRSCKSLGMLPEELMHIATLDKLELVNMQRDFASRLDGQTPDKIASDPYLRIFDHTTIHD